MNITGMDYFIISNKKPDIVLNQFNQEIMQMWSNCIIYPCDELCEERFFYSYVKDKVMEDFAEEHAYQLNQQGEGQIALACSPYSLLKMHTIAENAYYDDDEDEYQDYPTDSIARKNTFILYHIYRYNLILPDQYEHPFCQKIIKILENIISAP